jgi:hypothetical protein
MDPGSQRLIGPVSVAPVVDGKQGFLDDVFDIVLKLIEAPAQESTQVTTQFVEKRPIRSRVAIEPCQEERLQSFFDRTRWPIFLDSIHRTFWLQRARNKFPAGLPQTRGNQKSANGAQSFEGTARLTGDKVMSIHGAWAPNEGRSQT